MLIGKNLGDYRILAKTQLGESGFIYKAVHIARRQTYALKILNVLLRDENPEQHQFLEKLRQAQTIDHPNIARTYSLEFIDELSLIPLEFIYGGSLSENIADGPSTVDFTLRMALQAAQALEEAHDRGLVHGRITSNNLIVSAEGNLKIVDFALDVLPVELNFADSDHESLVTYFPTPIRPPLSRFAYQSPEQIRGHAAVARSDLFSLGVILYELLAGQFLFEGEDQQELYRQIQERDLPKISEVRPGIPSGWSRLLKALLEKNPQERYPSALQLVQDLRKLSYGLSLDRLSFQDKDPPISRRSFFKRFRGEREED
jgi:serine/threonine protein kinase